MGEGMGESILPGPQARIASFFLTKLDKEGLIHQGLIAFAINGATDTVLTALSNVSVARTPSTPER